ncbi:hypothetical protein VB264_15270 [Arcicella aquatica]|uniref:Uncharacterized protein n=1 Tax=Arcicella aquatica TaxID=217141 RepID=A0ABU5QPZ5_9BACT|nr:hypothetical protein [Arcicella aquatica]MEA5259155.1 hypothetical protein [Arcicella aquatica]
MNCKIALMRDKSTQNSTKNLRQNWSKRDNLSRNNQKNIILGTSPRIPEKFKPHYKIRLCVYIKAFHQ